MLAPVLATKLYAPPPRPNVVLRPHLIERLNEGLHHRLTLISAPAGFGKTTLVSEWAAACERPVAWLSLDEGDNDPTRFLTYLIGALQTVAAHIGAALLGVLQAPQPPPIESTLTTLVNEIATVPGHFVLVLDDFHVIEAEVVDKALSFLLERLPAQVHLVIATREDPPLPLARLRARGQLTELRAADLRFTHAEAAEFLNRKMGLHLAAADIAALESRTEGWIAGLHLAALSMQGQKDVNGFIQSFTGSHRFVLDYLVEEVLQQQPESVQTFLLRTSILDRLCGPLCDAVLRAPPGSGQTTLEHIEHANLFIVPLDNERRWYRYHHLFAELLRQRLQQESATSTAGAEGAAAELHIRASRWYEDNGLDIEAFRHAAAANDIERAERLIDGRGIPLHFRGAVTVILDWLGSLPAAVLNARPWLWWRYGALLLVVGQTTGVKEKLDAAEAGLLKAGIDDQSRNFVGRIAAARAVLALTQYDADTLLVQSRRALEYLDPKKLTLHANAHWTLGFGQFLLGDRAAARQAYTESIALSTASGDVFTNILATIGLGNVQEADIQLHQAAETYRRVLHVAGDQPLQIIHEAHLGLGRVLYEWNDLEAAEQHGRQSLHLARQYDRVIDRFVVCELFLARVKLAQGDLAGAATILAQAAQAARQKNFVHRLAEVAGAQVQLLLRQGKAAEAAQLAENYDLPISRARVHLARGDAAAALAALEPWRIQAEAKGWKDEQLKALVLEALAHLAQGGQDLAVRRLSEALVLAEPAGFIRLFVDEGLAMAQLLSEAAAQGVMPDYSGKLLAVIEAEAPPVVADGQTRATQREGVAPGPTDLLAVEPLSKRELEVLQLMAQGLSNGEISERLFLALSTVKGHNQKIFDKLQVQRRTEAVARARELGVL